MPFSDSQELKVGGEIVEISKKSLAGTSPKLFKTVGKLAIKPNNTDLNSKVVKCETFVESGSIKKASLSDSKKITVYCE